MKIIKEKRVRKEFLGNHIDLISSQLIKSITGIPINTQRKKSFRNICIISGRSRGVIKEYSVSRFVFRKNSDFGLLEG